MKNLPSNKWQSALAGAAFGAMLLASAGTAYAAPNKASDSHTAASADMDAAELAKAVDKLADPANQKAASAVLGAMGEALLSMKIGPVAAAINQAKPGSIQGNIAPDATVADLAGPDAKAMPQQLAKTAPAMMQMMGSMGKVFAQMMPQLAAAAKAMGEQMDKSMSASGTGASN